MEYARCAHCRNPIRGRQAMVAHARSDMTFHADCWLQLHAAVQAEYTQRAQDLGVVALLDPYQRSGMASWLPEAAIDAAMENLAEQLDEHLSGERVSVESGALEAVSGESTTPDPVPDEGPAPRSVES